MWASLCFPLPLDGLLGSYPVSAICCQAANFTWALGYHCQTHSWSSCPSCLPVVLTSACAQKPLHLNPRPDLQAWDNTLNIPDLFWIPGMDQPHTSTPTPSSSPWDTGDFWISACYSHLFRAYVKIFPNPPSAVLGLAYHAGVGAECYTRLWLDLLCLVK